MGLLPFAYPFMHGWTFGQFSIFLVIMNNAAMNIRVYVFPWGLYPGVELQGPVLIPCVTF